MKPSDYLFVRVPISRDMPFILIAFLAMSVVGSYLIVRGYPQANVLYMVLAVGICVPILPSLWPSFQFSRRYERIRALCYQQELMAVGPTWTGTRLVLSRLQKQAEAYPTQDAGQIEGLSEFHADVAVLVSELERFNRAMEQVNAG